MSPSLWSQFKDLLPGFFENHGRPAIFSPDGGTPVSCYIFVEYDAIIQPVGDAQSWFTGTVVEVCLSVIGQVPSRGDVFTCEGEVFTMESLVENDGLVAKVQVV